MLSDIFTTDIYDNNTAVLDDDKNYTFGDLKRIIALEANCLKYKKRNIIIASGNNFNFIIHFFASLFEEKNIYLVSDKSKLKYIDFEYDILDEVESQGNSEYDFLKNNIEKSKIIFFTSGSTTKPKMITKSIHNLIAEGIDIGKELNITNKKLTVYSTTTMCHLFGLTFHLMFPLCNGFKIATTQISYPENLCNNNSILVSTPAFLNSILKFNISFTQKPKYIFSAGSKLENNLFKYLENLSNVVEIYGSTESGVIAYKTNYNKPFRLFPNIQIRTEKDCAII